MPIDQNDLDLANQISHVPLLGTLEAKVEPGHTALIVVDVQNDFCAPGGMMAEEGFDVSPVQAMADRLPALIATARAAGALVVFIRNIYTSDGNVYLSDTWLEQASRARAGSYTRRDICREGSWEGDFYGEVRPEPGDPLIVKHRFSAFHNTELDTVLRSHGIRTLVMTGVASNVCVETTAREGFVRDYYIVFTADGTACYSDADHQATLRNIDRFFGQITTVGELAAIWDGRAKQAAE
jgi:ureidoacrylate peracid hydrolase